MYSAGCEEAESGPASHREQAKVPGAEIVRFELGNLKEQVSNRTLDLKRQQDSRSDVE
jgi:hypothetical protein